MKKFWLLALLILGGCLTAPQKNISIDEEILFLPVHKIEVVSMAPRFEELPHIENQMPLSPEDALIQWSKKNLKAEKEEGNNFYLVIKQAEMTKLEKKNPGLFNLDEEIYTLVYSVELQFKNQEEVIQKIPVKGKGFISIAKKADLAQKEKGWEWLIQKMLTHIKTKLKNEIPAE